VKKLYPVDEDGLETLFIQGRWSRKGGVRSRDQAPKILRSLSKCEKYFLRSPEVVGKKLRVAIEGKQSEIDQLLAKFDKLKVPYRIAKAPELAIKADFVLHLAT
jgi:hypothetical protein